jgi:hypothetical protein
VSAAVAQNGMALRFASPELQADKAVVLGAVASKGKALRFASTELRANKEVVLTAVSQQGKALRYSSDKLKNDMDTVVSAVAQDGGAIMYGSIGRVDVVAFVRRNHVAHLSFVAFLLAERSSAACAIATPAAMSPVLRNLKGIGEDAGRHVRGLVAALAGVPSGRAWVVIESAASRAEAL